jgi:filamentous hemagglutinin
MVSGKCLPEINRLTGGRPVQFRHGSVDLSPYTILEYTFRDLTGGKSDFTKANTKLAKVLGLSSAKAAKEWCRAMKLTWHHHQNGKSMQLVPYDLNNGIPHIGGASHQRQ